MNMNQVAHRRSTSVARLTLAVFSILCTSIVSLSASDLNSLTIKGNVVQMDIVKSSGTYVETLLYVWDYDPSTPLQATILRCNGNGGGSLTNCLYPSAFCSTSTHTGPTHDINETSLTTDRYTCNPSTSRMSGECVVLTSRTRILDQNVYEVFADGHAKSIQALSLDVVDVGYGSGCTSK